MRFPVARGYGWSMGGRAWKWIAAGLVLAGVAFSLWWFTPWRLFTTRTVADELPVIASSAPAQPSGPATPKPVNRVLADGAFVSHEHDTSGTVQIVRLADGRTQLVIKGLRTSDGPDVRVWLTDREVVDGQDWDVFDDGAFVDLGALKGNEGNLVYTIGAGVDLTAYRSVDIWCRRFHVSFGAAALTARSG
jgi:hypothetical protein